MYIVPTEERLRPRVAHSGPTSAYKVLTVSPLTNSRCTPAYMLFNGGLVYFV